MATPQRIAKDEPERIVLNNISEFGWHCVNVIEDDGHPPWSILRRPGCSHIPVFARHRRVRRASPTRLPDFVRYPIHGPRNIHE
jgi:hypothetical protein